MPYLLRLNCTVHLMTVYLLHRQTDSETESVGDASTCEPPPLKKSKSSLFASYDRHSAKASTSVTRHRMNLQTRLMDYIAFATCPRPQNVDPWAEFAKNENYKPLHPLLEKIFSPPATSAPVERIFSHSGLLMRPNRARMGDKLLEQLMFLRCNNKL